MVKQFIEIIYIELLNQQSLICDMITDGTINKTIDLKLKEARVRFDLACSILPDTTSIVSDCGFYIWYNLPEPWSGYAFEAHANKMDLNVFCSEKFTVGTPNIAPSIRISLTAPKTIHELEVGLRRINKLLNTGYLPMDNFIS